MAQCYYNGYLLPELPADILETHPYGILIHLYIPSQGLDFQGLDLYDFLLSTCRFYESNNEEGTTSLLPSDTTGTGCLYICSLDADTFEISMENQSLEDFPVDIGEVAGVTTELIWSNTDIPSGSIDSTEVFFSGNESIPESQKCSITISTVAKLAKQARKINGSDEPLEFSEILSVFDSAVKGVAGGHTVSMFDPSNELIQVSSVKDGTEIPEPYYTLAGWVDSDKNHISFPYTPTADISLFDSSAEHEIYQFFGINKEEYPYLLLHDVSTYFYIHFLKTLRMENDLPYITGKLTLFENSKVDYTDVWSVAKSVIENAVVSSLTELSSESFTTLTSGIVYLNKEAYDIFDAYTFIGTTPVYHRLDEA